MPVGENTQRPHGAPWDSHGRCPATPSTPSSQCGSDTCLPESGGRPPLPITGKGARRSSCYFRKGIFIGRSRPPSGMSAPEAPGGASAHPVGSPSGSLPPVSLEEGRCPPSSSFSQPKSVYLGGSVSPHAPAPASCQKVWGRGDAGQPGPGGHSERPCEVPGRWLASCPPTQRWGRADVAAGGCRQPTGSPERRARGPERKGLTGPSDAAEEDASCEQGRPHRAGQDEVRLTRCGRPMLGTQEQGQKT